MLQGKPLKIITKFSLPILFGYILQNIYSIADSSIVGQTLGTDALAAVGATGVIFSLFVTVIGGMMSGFAAVAGKKYGAADFEGLKKVYTNGLILTLAISFLMTIPGVIYAKDLLLLMNTPPEIIDSSASYLRIIFAGTITTMLYSFSGEMLRAVGNSKKPFFYLLISSTLNIIMNFWFILGLKLGVGGAAIATVISQAISAILCMIYTFRSVEYFSFRKHELKPDRQITAECLRIGLPNALLNGTILFGIVVMQFVTNGFGKDYVAAYSGSATVSNFLLFPIYAFTASVGIFTAQNFGAGNLKRIKTGARDTMFMLFGAYAVFSLILFFSSEPLLKLIYGYDNKTAADAALLLNTKALTIHALIPLSFYKVMLQSVGKPLFPTISGFLEIGVRFMLATQITKIFGFFGIALTDPITWILTCIFFIVVYKIEFHKLEKSMKSARVQ